MRPRSLDAVLSAELKAMFESLNKCLELRDKYIKVSQQRLGDNPKDHDGTFTGFKGDAGDVSGIKPDAPASAALPPSENSFPKWRIYPKPPPPHWHYKQHPTTQEKEDESFDFSTCPIPEGHSWDFKLDEKGVFQVYDSTAPEGMCLFTRIIKFDHRHLVDNSKMPVFDIPTIREYFMDLEYVLGVIGDGPTKSFAYRRIKYLISKFTMYNLLNEFQEMTDMKVWYFLLLS